MTNDGMKELIEKIQFQINTIGEMIDHKKYPLIGLIISMGWGRQDLNNANDIFENWSKKLENGEALERNEFEKNFSDSLGIDYQDLKLVILSFYRDNQWTNVCEAYVDSFLVNTPIEYSDIMNRLR